MHPSLTTTLAPLDRLSIPWAVAGGWAIDLAIGQVTRPHADVDVAIFRDDQAALHSAFPGWAFEVAVNGRLRPWHSTEWLALPLFEVYATPPNSAQKLELLLNERNGSDWVFRRDAAIRLPLARALILSPSGVPVLAPEVVLLYKSKNPRANDEHDFRTALPYLGEDPRKWLAHALDHTRPDHGWRASLDGGAA